MYGCIIRGCDILAALCLFVRRQSFNSVGVRGNAYVYFSRWPPNLKKKRTFITMIQGQYLSFAAFPTPLCFSLVSSTPCYWTGVVTYMYMLAYFYHLPYCTKQSLHLIKVSVMINLSLSLQ
jgi:hypothetical protein